MLEARARQAKRFGQKGPLVNGRMTPRQLRKLCQFKPDAMSILKAAMEELGLSARAHDKVLRVARTIADLEGSDEIKPQHIAEAVGYRSLDRSVWMGIRRICTSGTFGAQHSMSSTRYGRLWILSARMSIVDRIQRVVQQTRERGSGHASQQRT